MNKIVNKFLLAGSKFLPELHLMQPGFTYSTCGPLTNHRERIKNFKETGDLNYVYKNDSDKTCFAHNAAYYDSKDLAKRTISSEISKS